MSKKVSIATKPLVYSTFRYISNHVWNAIGEYIDNSIQSFLDHQDVLKKINLDGKLHVEVKFDFENDIITIKDDAFGIEAENFDRAFELANIPLDAGGLNEFGMGMKVSSIWLSNLWKVETTALGENVKKTVVFNLNEVVDKQETELDVKEEPFDANAHYTLITLENLSQNKPTSRQHPYICKHLASIYTKFIRNGILELIVNGEVLSDTVLKVLKSPYYKTPEGNEIEWKKNIHFEAGPYKVDGFIGILEKMSTSTDNGFMLFRRNKVIGTSYDTKYRPKRLCGEPGSPRYKRIFGELELEGFSVSFTKNAFTQDDDLEAFIYALADDLSKDKEFKIFDHAQNYTPTKSKKEKTVVATNLVKTIATGFTKPIVIKKPEPKEPQLPIVEIEKPVITVPTPVPTQEPKPEVQEIPVTADGYSFTLSIVAEENNSMTDFYDLIVVDKDKYRSTINMKHKFFERFSQLVNNKQDYLPISAMIRTMIISEILLLQNKDYQGSKFRYKFNEIFGYVDI